VRPCRRPCWRGRRNRGECRRWKSPTGSVSAGSQGGIRGRTCRWLTKRWTPSGCGATRKQAGVQQLAPKIK
jgi:hypothetical protein